MFARLFSPATMRFVMCMINAGETLYSANAAALSTRDDRLTFKLDAEISSDFDATTFDARVISTVLAIS